MPTRSCSGASRACGRAATTGRTRWRLMREYGPIVRYGKTLFDYGVKGGDIDLLAKASMQNTVAYATNPGPFTIEDSYAIYHKLLGV